MKVCDRCKTKDGVESVIVRLYRDRGKVALREWTRKVELCRECIAKSGKMVDNFLERNDEGNKV